MWLEDLEEEKMYKGEWGNTVSLFAGYMLQILVANANDEKADLEEKGRSEDQR